jgi:alcohol dehydrogenase
MSTFYCAMQVARPGVLELVERPVPTPGDEQVLLTVEACGICGADASDIERADATGRVPGHEVVGRIAALGARVPPFWRVGQRVGVGRLGGHCQVCGPCRQGRFNLCESQPVLGVSCDGGYAERMLARATGLVSIPDDLDAEHAAPLLCAGIATFNALRKCGAEPGDTIAVLGIGGLGHMAVQYAQRLGYRVVAIGRGSERAFDALALGAHHVIDTARDHAVERLRSLGGAQALVTTTSQADAVSSLLPALAPGGRVVVLGAGKEPLSVGTGWLVGGERSLVGSITGTPQESERALRFSVLTGALPRIEVLPLEQANAAYQRMRAGEVRYRMVLRMPPVPMPD